MRIVAVCNTCAHKHKIEFDPTKGPGAAFSDWMVKHPEHDVDFIWPGRTAKKSPKLANLKGYIDNADVKIAYAADVDYTITIASLASSSTLLVGRESNAIDNITTTLYLDFMVTGQITVGTSPTAGAIQVIAIGALDDTPTYPDVFDGVDSAETITSDNIKNSIARYVATMTGGTTSDRAYPFGPVSLASLFGGIVPTHHVMFLTHYTVASLNSTAGNHFITSTGIYATVV